MRKAGIVILVVAVCIGGLGLAGWQVLHTPSYALQQTVRDVKDSGLEGLRPHLTERGTETLDLLQEVKDTPYVGSLLQAAKNTEEAQQMLRELSEIQWTPEDVRKGQSTAQADVRFSYKDLFSGTLEIEMKKENGAWKIDGFSLTEFSWQSDTSKNAAS